jgi:hypothetical protein
MAEEPGDRGEVLAGVQHVPGEGMAQRVGSHPFQPGPLGVLADDELDRVRLQRLPALADEEVVAGDLGPRFLTNSDGLPHVVVERYRPILVALAAAYHQTAFALGDGDIGQPQVAELAHADAGVA